MSTEQNKQFYDVASAFCISKLEHCITRSDDMAYLMVSDVVGTIEHSEKIDSSRKWTLYFEYLFKKPNYVFLSGSSWLQDKTTKGARMSIIQDVRKNDESETPIHWVDYHAKTLYTFTTNSYETHEVTKKWTKVMI